MKIEDNSTKFCEWLFLYFASSLHLFSLGIAMHIFTPILSANFTTTVNY